MLDYNTRGETLNTCEASWVQVLFHEKKSQAQCLGFFMRKMGLEPTRPCGHKILSLARLPIPTLPRLPRDSYIITKGSKNVKQKYEKNFFNFF